MNYTFASFVFFLLVGCAVNPSYKAFNLSDYDCINKERENKIATELLVTLNKENMVGKFVNVNNFESYYKINYDFEEKLKKNISKSLKCIGLDVQENSKNLTVYKIDDLTVNTILSGNFVTKINISMKAEFLLNDNFFEIKNTHIATKFNFLPPKKQEIEEVINQGINKILKNIPLDQKFKTFLENQEFN